MLFWGVSLMILAVECQSYPTCAHYSPYGLADVAQPLCSHQIPWWTHPHSFPVPTMVPHKVVLHHAPKMFIIKFRPESSSPRKENEVLSNQLPSGVQSDVEKPSNVLPTLQNLETNELKRDDPLDTTNKSIPLSPTTCDTKNIVSNQSEKFNFPPVVGKIRSTVVTFETNMPDLLKVLRPQQSLKSGSLLETVKVRGLDTDKLIDSSEKKIDNSENDIESSSGNQVSDLTDDTSENEISQESTNEARDTNVVDNLKSSVDMLSMAKNLFDRDIDAFDPSTNDIDVSSPRRKENSDDSRLPLDPELISLMKRQSDLLSGLKKLMTNHL